MDPEVTLRQLRMLVDDVNDTRDRTDDDLAYDLTEQAENFATLFEGLDQWLTKKGFKPNDWK